MSLLGSFLARFVLIVCEQVPGAHCGDPNCEVLASCWIRFKGYHLIETDGRIEIQLDDGSFTLIPTGVLMDSLS
jgi:hypothetical protein